MLNKFFSVLSFVFLISQSVQAAPVKTGKFFERAIIVIFENTNYEDAIKQSYFAYLAKSGAHFTNIHGVTHPSQPNYFALTSGSVHGVTNSKIIDLDVPNISHLLEAKNLSWKVYVEDFPGNCFTGPSSDLYERRHNPFISYVNIQKNPALCSKIVNASQFEIDAAAGKLPHYVFYIPNNKNSGHNTGVVYASEWYGNTFSKYVNDSRLMKDTVLMTTFDESGSLASNQIYVSIVGSMVKPGEYSEKLDLFSLFHLLEVNWDLGSFGKEDSMANPVPNIWR